MKHEKIIKRADGSRVRITVELRVEWLGVDPVRWSFATHRCAKGKRTWVTFVNHDDYSWRKLSDKERSEEDERRSLLLATKPEVESVMLELWEKVKPSLGD